MGEKSPSVLTKKQAKKVFLTHGSSHPELARDTASEMGIVLGKTTLRVHPNTERYARYADSVRGKHVIIMQPHGATRAGSVNDAIQEQLLMVDAARSSSAREITVVSSALAYTRSDRKAKGREPIGVRTLINQFAAVGVNRIVTVDMHSAQSQGIFNGPFDHLTAQPLLRGAIRGLVDMSSPDRYAVVAPDSGSVKMSDYHGDRLNLDVIHMSKKRDRKDPTKIIRRPKVPEVDGRVCFLFDDMLDTAGTAMTAVEVLKNSGADKVYIAATHGVFSGGAYERINNAPIDGIYVTDTLPMDEAKEALGDRLHVISVAPMLGHAIKEIVTMGSVSHIFEDQNHM